MRKIEEVEFGSGLEDLWMLEAFAREVRFSISWKREMLEDAISFSPLLPFYAVPNYIYRSL